MELVPSKDSSTPYREVCLTLRNSLHLFHRSPGASQTRVPSCLASRGLTRQANDCLNHGALYRVHKLTTNTYKTSVHTGVFYFTRDEAHCLHPAMYPSSEDCPGITVTQADCAELTEASSCEFHPQLGCC